MKIVDFTPDVFNFQVTIDMLDKFCSLAIADSSLIQNDGSRGNGDAGITPIGPNAIFDQKNNLLGIRVTDGVADFGVSLQRDSGKQTTQLRLKDSNPNIPPIWMPDTVVVRIQNRNVPTDLAAAGKAVKNADAPTVNALLAVPLQ